MAHDVGHRITLLVPLSMPPAVQARIRSDRSAWARLTAGTLKAEGVAVDRVAADPSVLDTDTETVYGDDVQQPTHLDLRDAPAQGAAQHSGACPSVAGVELLQAWGEAESVTLELPNPHYSERDRREEARRAFLRRVQYVDPRERRT